jgi:hypothetical protein
MEVDRAGWDKNSSLAAVEIFSRSATRTK